MKKFLELFERLVVSQERLAAAHEKAVGAVQDMASESRNMSIRAAEYIDKFFHSTR
jgi:hypothetical protein